VFISFVQLPYPIYLFSWFSCVVFSSFAMITYLVEADKVAGLKAPLEDEELSVKVVEGLKELK